MRVRPLIENNTYPKVIQYKNETHGSSLVHNLLKVVYIVSSGKTIPFHFFIRCECHKLTNANIFHCVSGIIKYAMLSLKQKLTENLNGHQAFMILLLFYVRVLFLIYLMLQVIYNVPFITFSMCLNLWTYTFKMNF